jgi:transcriptional regulator with XRE-family HTH domain
VSIGATLAAARRRSGLTVGEVSRRTRIRAAIVEGIERDDYSACGGDFYARGHIRAIARALKADPGPLIQEYDATQRTTEEITETVVLHPAAPGGIRERHRLAWIAALGLAVLAILGWAAYHFASATAGPGGAAVARTGHAVTHHQAGAARNAGHGKPGPAPAATHSTAAPAAPVQALAPVSAAAFGPGGTGQGDAPQLAALAIDGNPATAWHTDWYTTAAFGNLQPGTGLLLDMGRPVTITAAQITLGGIPGAALQLRAGDVPVLADLREVASAADAGGVVRPWFTAAAHARYLLIWFTSLPPNTSGTFQASIYNVSLEGRP